MQIPSTKVTPIGMKILLWGIVALIVMNLLGRFDLIPSITNQQSDVLTLMAALFIAAEIGVMQLLKSRKGFTVLNIIGSVVVGLAILGVLTSWIGVSLAFLQSAQSIVDLALLAYVLIEIFN